MTTIISQLKTAAHKRAAYRRTVAEISRLPIDTALDLDMYRGDAAKIAHRAVYGR